MTDCPTYRSVDEVLHNHLAGARCPDGHQPMPATTVTRRLIWTAISGGLRPHLEPPPKRKPRKGTPPPKVYRVLLNYPSRDGLFGALHISGATGVVLYANLCYGNHGTERRYHGVAEVRRELNGWWRDQHVQVLR